MLSAAHAPSIRSAAAGSPEGRQARGEVGAHVKVLIVEDDVAIRSLIAATIPDDWDVLEVGDGLEALVAARRYRPDAIILDHDLPLLSGAEVCAALRAEPWCRGVGIVALTAHEDTGLRRAFAAAGADAFVTKPFSPVALLDLLDRWETSRA